MSAHHERVRASWRHSACDSCWSRLFQSSRGAPVRYQDAEVEACCFCSATTLSGIYVRADPNDLLCHGNHPED